MGSFFSLQDAIDYANNEDRSLWPEKYIREIADVAWHQVRYRKDHPAAHSYEELHPTCKKMLEPFLGSLPDLYLTGSWLGGWWSHPEFGAKDKQELRAILGKPLVSDLDFWTPTTPRKEAMDVLKNIGRKHEIPVSWVTWWGPAMELTSGEAWVPANEQGVYKAEWSYLNGAV